MRNNLDDFELEDVNGGTTVITNVYNAVSFKTQGKKYDLTVDWKTARDYRDELLESNPQLNDAEFDKYCMQQFDAKGWLAPYTKTKRI